MTSPTITFDKDAFDRDGYVVIRNVFPRELCHAIRDNLAECQASYTPAIVDSKTGKARTEFIGGVHRINKCAGQHPCLDKLRANATLADIFRQFYGTKTVRDLRASMDGFCYHPVPASEMPPADWAHVDVGDKNPPYVSIQGQVILSDAVDEHSGGLVVWPTSHLYHAQALGAERALAEEQLLTGAKPPRFDVNFVKISPEVRARILECRPGCVRTNVAVTHQVRMGDVVLWHSKTLHMYDPPTALAKEARCVAYVTYCPAEYLTRRDKEHRAVARKFNRTTSHWPGGNQVRLNSAIPRLYKRERVDEFRKVAANGYSSENVALSEAEQELLGYVIGDHDLSPAEKTQLYERHVARCERAQAAAKKRREAKLMALDDVGTAPVHKKRDRCGVDRLSKLEPKTKQTAFDDAPELVDFV